MTGSDAGAAFRAAWKELDVAVISAVGGSGRTLVERTGGIGDQAESIRRAAVLSRDLRFMHEPGWMLRKLPDGRLAILVGGTQHPKLLDEFGRTGIFHGVALVTTRKHVGALLATHDLHGMAWSAVHHHIHGERTDVPVVAAPLHVKWLPGREVRIHLEAPQWQHVRSLLSIHGVRPFTAPVMDDGRPALALGAAPVQSGRTVTQRRVPDARALTERVLAAWPA